MEYEPDACMVCGATKEKLFRKPTSSINIPSKNVQEKSNKKEVVQESLEKSKRELEELKKQFSEEYKP